jgi:5-formyltetrahydrofolate cyclo-ligase
MADESSAVDAAKAQLRAKLRFRRDQHAAALPEFVRAIAFRAPPGPLRAVLESARCVGGYAGTASEAPVDGLLAVAAGAKVATAMPFFTARDDAMEFCLWRAGDELEPGPWRVLQPAITTETAQPDVILCPLLGFDRSGGRIGQGGGHYDRYLAARPDALRIGIGWSVQEIDAVPLGPFDRPLDAILTEQEYIVTGDRL